jgi:thiol-disulfide isomerase/thioredoxin
MTKSRRGGGGGGLQKFVSGRMKLIQSVLAPSNWPRLLVVLVLLGILYWVYAKYLKEAFEGMLPGSGEVDAANFDSALDGSKQLVLFYASWCGHCKKLKPDWDTATGLAGSGKLIKVNVGDDTPEQTALNKRFKITGYPTIMLFENGKATEYQGDRDPESLAKAVKG